MDATAIRAAGPPAKGGGGRLPLLDVLRGVAILGTLGTNVWIFASPGGEAAVLTSATAFSPIVPALADPGVGTVLEAVVRFAANGKFLALLTVLFGVGLAIQFRSAERHGRRWPGTYVWRALFLFVEGTVHFVLVFAFDVLMGYAVVALLTAWLLARSERVRSVVLWASAGVHVLLMGAATAVLVAQSEPAPPPDPDGTNGVPEEFVRLYAEGSYLDQVGLRLSEFAVFRLEPVISFALLLFLFLLGVRLFRAGAFGDDAAGRRVRARMLAWGLGLGLPLNAATTLAGPPLALADRYVAAPLVAVGLMGLVGWLLDRTRRPGPVVGALSALGRAALSGYVLQNVVCMLVCYGFGLGLAARMTGTGPWWVFALWTGVSLALLVGASLWLRRFPHGPLEAVQKWTLARLPGGR
jgi:uncharacterized protein